MSHLLAKKLEDKVTLISLDIAAVTLRNASACEVSAEDNDLWYEVVLDAVLEHAPQTRQRRRVVKPNVGEKEHRQVRQVHRQSTCELGLAA
jgi:hypothetical protein